MHKVRWTKYWAAAQTLGTLVPEESPAAVYAMSQAGAFYVI
ncbi:MAG: hypothetical protein WCC26_03280 [Terracidiphilus sp.]